MSIFENESNQLQSIMSFKGTLCVSFFDLFTVSVVYDYSPDQIRIYPASLLSVVQQAWRIFGAKPQPVRSFAQLSSYLNFVECRQGTSHDRCETAFAMNSYYSQTVCTHHTHHMCGTHVYRWIRHVVQPLILHRHDPVRFYEAFEKITGSEGVGYTYQEICDELNRLADSCCL